MGKGYRVTVNGKPIRTWAWAEKYVYYNPNPFQGEVMNWEAFRFQDIPCQLTPRETWHGNPIKPNVEPYIGATVYLTVGWKMDDQDKYPGEYALIPANPAADDIFRQMGITWIASGDVTLLGNLPSMRIS